MSLRSTVAVRCRQRRTKNSLNKNYNYTEHIGALHHACSYICVCWSLEITVIAFDINSTANTMESEYDRKFEDMKKYIPFLESMIKRLESTSSMPSNPRQAQLDKIRSLRDLLLDKKKRMKMENLLKCEQVLINLYAKVEQRDTLPNTKKTANSGVSDSSRMESNSKLDILRSKLKRVSNIQDGADTLPEIVRASDVEDVCMPGSVEPALFQRRPHKKSPTLSDISSSSHEKPKSPEVNSKRKYTRVLYSPEPESRPRPVDQDNSSGSPLFSRRSPKKSTLHNKTEGSKPTSHKTQKDTKDFNITLNVPQESLNSLNTDDILSRIITCNDNDVDIETLRGLRSQILSELKQTGANDDISDLILKSYAAKKSTKAKEEVEEGELSDSESEAIEKIYGNLVRENKDNTNNEVKSASEKDQPRKIQICLVINPKDSESSIKSSLKPIQDGKEDLELIGDIKKNQTETVGEQAGKSAAKLENTSDVVIIDDDDSPVKEQEFIKVNIQVTESKNSKDVTPTSAIKTDDQITEKNETSKNSTSIKTGDTIVNKKKSNMITTDDTTISKINENDDDKSQSSTVLDKDTESLDLLKKHEKQCDPSVQFKANFYKPLLDEENNGSSNSVNKLDECPSQLAEPKISPINISPFDKNECIKIPLLGEPIICNKPPEKDIDSQIDILQALKNEILGDNILSGPSRDVATPPLHQPKITKVSQALEIMPKKRISIEKYKEKTTPVTLNSSQSADTHLLSPKDDNVKKQSLKLTEKECERFNFPAKISITDDVSSEDEDQKESNMSSLDLYENFAPKSPDHDDTHFSEKTQPVIIPIDPIKGPVANFKADVDMRTLPLSSPKEIPVISNSAPITYGQKNKEIKTKEIKLDIRVDMPSRNQSPLIDPRMNRDANQSNKIDSSNLAGMNVDNNFTPCMTSSSRSYDMTPSRLNDFDVPNTSHNRVYTPSFSSFDSRDSCDQFILKDACSPKDSEIGTGRRNSRREEYNDHDSRSNFSPTDNIQRAKYTDTYKPDINTGNVVDRHVSDQNDDSVRANRPMTPLPVFGWSDTSPLPNSYARSDGPVPLMMMKYGRPDCPSTPSHPFGRSDCPSALGHPFPRLDMPGTPNHPFGRPECRSECPATPIHPFGRAECPPTPTHQFGRSDIPPTPMLGRSDCPSTPTHPFGRIDCPPSLNNSFARMDFPSTPNHPFAMSDCPGTPNHPFGRTDCSPTPNHQLGRLECPQTPTHSFSVSESTTTSSHQFGRVEGGMAPKYSFGRTEQSQNIPIIQPYSKDPRLNRRSESRSRRDERDNRNYKDRNFSTNNSYQMQNRHFNRSESHTHTDRDDRISRSMLRTERNFGHSKYRENYLDQPSSADKRSSYNYDNRSRCRERSSDDRNRPGKSPGRNHNSREHFVRSSSRGRSISRNDNRKTENDNIVSFKSLAGRSYTIDTSVNSTFQELLKKKGLEIRNTTFHSRKQRAASLGRSLALCLNEERISKNISARSIADDSKCRSKNYRRASSVGRDLLDKHESFQSVKADFKNYQAKVAKQHEMQRHSQRNKKCFDNQIDKSPYKTAKIVKPAYSPRKNSRDPRMRREYDDKNKHGGEKHKHGINYSNDNLARGVVLNSGYGVKNYKIPKIKRVTNDNQDEVNLNNDKNNADKKEKKDTTKVIDDATGKNSSSEDRNVSERSPERMLLRSFKAGKNVAVSTKRTRIENRKPRRPVIYDSSSDDETIYKNTLTKKVLSSDDENCSKLNDDQTIQKFVTNSVSDMNKIVSDNVPKPVVDNIKTATSNTDDHIDSYRTESNEGLKDITSDEDISNMESIDVSKENTFKGLFNKDNVIDGKIVDAPQDENVTTGKVVPCIDNLSETVIQNMDELSSKAPATLTEANKFDADQNQIDNDDNKVDNMESPSFKCKTDTNDVNDEGVLLKNTDKNKTNTNSDAIVSTTENDKDVTNMQEDIVKSTENNELNFETSAADSTNEVINDKTKDHNVPDSTNDVHIDTNSLVSSSFISTHVPTKMLAETNISQPDIAQPLNSYGSILSILQDKSKIHQLLSMIEESADNNKLKRKLEKLTEIVSDDEEEAFDKTANKPNDVNVTNKEEVDEIANKQIKTPLGEQLIETKLQNDSEIVSITNAENDAEDKVTTLELSENSKDDKKSKDVPKVNAIKKGKGPKRGKGRFTKANKTQRVTRAASGNVVKIPTVKKPSRELMKLREDIKEMFLTDEMLNSTGIRMCRLAKLVDEKSSNRKDETQETKPVVVIEKCKDQDNSEEAVITEKSSKKKISKIKRKVSANEDSINEETKAAAIKSKTATKLFSVPKSKNKSSSKQEDKDPYEYESDSVDTGTVKGSESEGVSDCETNSLASSKSFGSSEVLAELQRKTKRKRRGKAWQTGIIKPKHKKKKIKLLETSVDDDTVHKQKKIPDNECFIDKFYCFEKNVSTYSCRLCEYTGDDIVIHYKKQHPHTEIPLSRMNPVIAKEAVEQCQEVNFPTISKIPTDKYVCRFCFKEFSKNKSVLETFFWHVVSMHTGEYKQACSECVNNTCHFNLDIPPPPKDNSGQLIGYLCDKCNFTQVSLENLKTHVIGRHNDEQTDVYTINLAAMSKKTLKTLAKQQSAITPRVLRSLRSNQSCDNTDDHNETVENPTVIETVPQNEAEAVPVKIEKKAYVSSMQTKIAFESEEMITESDPSQNVHDSPVEIKQENIETEEQSHLSAHAEPEVPESNIVQIDCSKEGTQLPLPDDVMAHAHFKISYKESGAKEYVCCINGKENHYKTTLLISMKKHVQTKHGESWDGYCVLCKVIVTTQGIHNFRDCLQHFIDKHMDEFPVLEIPKVDSPTKIISDLTEDISKSYLNKRPLNQLLFNNVETDTNSDTTTQFPKIESVVSLGAAVSLPQSSPTYPPVMCIETQEEKQYRYEDWQAEVMSKKHRVVLNPMMSEGKLVKVFKCTGKFCSFTTDNAENALLHATTHQDIGGEGALNCSYCDFDASNNGIDLVMHVFKAHGKCPYACKLCFYRATSSQLVNSHVRRMHSERQSFDAILHSTTIATPVADDHNLMSREEAVPYYVCGYPSFEGEGSTCKYKTFTPGQFGEHLVRHRPPYPCNMCQCNLNSVSDLIHHMKTHGLRLYQCAFCVFGANNEAEMLAHASSRHPDRLPQAYLRVVTNKDGSAELRVLPRAFLNKVKTPSRDVSSADTDNPVIEAKRSVALEKLIGDTESATSIEPIQAKNDADDDDVPADIGIVEDSEQLLVENTEQEPVPPAVLLTPDKPSRKSSTASLATEIQTINQEDDVKPVVKTEPAVSTPNVPSDSVIYCLDSDDESRPRVIDISDDDLGNTATTTSKAQEPTTYVKVSIDRLFLCPKCKTYFRNMSGFKRHITTCLNSLSVSNHLIQCPHDKCTNQIPSISEVADHYFKCHADRQVIIFSCGICKAKFKTAPLTKKHMKEMHKSVSFKTNEPVAVDGATKVSTIIEMNVTQSATARQKSSADAAKQQKRYGPQDIDQLPINPILDSLVYCSLCEFNTKVRLNMVRHLQLHAEQQPVPQTAPVNPVPHLETNERHFDKMVNLASSSIINRTTDKANKVDVLPIIPATEVGRYPKYVPDRMRYTCGTKNCSYISVDEAMLRIHWETLHSNTNDYLCVHCPPHQHLDQSKPLTAVRIIGHLKMHEADLYACSVCCYYHFKRVVVEKHLQKCLQLHKDAHLMVVREGGVTPTPAPTPTAAAPTMDLKPWQCGLCCFKSMLRPEVADHCFKIHQSKMQYKCNYCPFRTSGLENVAKHQANSHSDKVEDVFYYYYREGSIPDDDGTPRWITQKQRSGATEPVVKTELSEPSTSQCDLATITPTPVAVNLSLVKQEIEDPEIPNADGSIQELCEKFGRFCEPSGLKYKCPLCTAVLEDTALSMQSHLFEELKYRKWGCSVCSYKAFHKTGLNEHIKSEHHRQFQEPIELPTDVNVEKWVAGLLEYQTECIAKNKLLKQTEEEPSSSKSSEDIDASFHHLVQAFGSLGTPRDNVFCCPKCNCTFGDERTMKEHLEIELTKIRWCCSNCSFMSSTYHEAQFHCKSAHPGESASPREALRSADKRADWVDAVLYTQKRALKPSSPVHTQEKNTDLPDPNDNSLLVVRYEEPVPSTTEDTGRRKRSAPADSDEEKLVIDETEIAAKKKSAKDRFCPFCDFKTKWANALREHILRHYNLKPFKCRYCGFSGYRPMVLKHFEKAHPEKRLSMIGTPVPTGPPTLLVLPKHNTRKTPTATEDTDGQICLECGQTVPEKELALHIHGGKAPEIVTKGQVVVKCCICSVLRSSVAALCEHHNECHPHVPVNYTYFKLKSDPPECYYCYYCNGRFNYIADLKSHHRASHNVMELKYNTNVPHTIVADEESNVKRKNEDSSIEPKTKRVAKKSTTKLPHNAVAKKSTTKLPHSVNNTDEDMDEYSYYGLKPPTLDNYCNVTTLMPFCNTMVPFTVKKLSEIIKIEPIVLVDKESC